MALFAALGAENISIGDAQLRELVKQSIEASGAPPKRMLLLPPDHTRLNSRAGRIVEIIFELYGAECEIKVMPALGTHTPMGEAELNLMFGPSVPRSAFCVHDWRHGVRRMGVIPEEMVRKFSGGKFGCEITIETAEILFDGWDLIVSIGQVVPHEVVGMANYTKNIMVGAGGSDIINKSHFLGAVSGMETLMGRDHSPVRELFDYGVATYLGELPIVYMLTVMERDADGAMAMRGFYSGRDREAFERASALSVKTNLVLLDRPLKKVIVTLDPEEFKSTWLGNKSIYRTRMAMADGGELIILSPGLREFGEDKEIDRLIRKYGYFGTPATLAAVEKNAELRANLGAAAHLIHGSSEGRFGITYCPGALSRAEIESVGFKWGEIDEMRARYQVDSLKDGFNTVNGEELFFISNPALGLWALKKSLLSQIL